MDCVRKKSLVLGIGILLVGVPRSYSQTANPFVAELRQEWEVHRTQVMRSTEPMPDDKFQYRPTPKDRSFQEILVHLIVTNKPWMEAVAGEPDSGWAKRVQGLKTKAEIMKATVEYLDYGAKVLANLTDQKAMELIASGRRKEPRWVVVFQAIRHGSEHYGTFNVFLAVNGVPRGANN